MAILAKAPYFVGFTINAAIGGALYGWLVLLSKGSDFRSRVSSDLTQYFIITAPPDPLRLQDVSNAAPKLGFWSLRLGKAVIFLAGADFSAHATGRAMPIQTSLAKRFATRWVVRPAACSSKRGPRLILVGAFAPSEAIFQAGIWYSCLELRKFGEDRNGKTHVTIIEGAAW